MDHYVYMSLSLDLIPVDANPIVQTIRQRETVDLARYVTDRV